LAKSIVRHASDERHRDERGSTRRAAVEDNHRMKIALISEVFTEESSPERLVDLLRDAASRGARVALLPELPLNRWVPAGQQPRDEDAEPPEVGGAIVRDPATGTRHNTALVFAPDGTLLATYRKVHLPEEEGFWETRHYEPGDALSPVLRDFELPIGLQICSDANRPEGCHLLGALGAHAILNPRATEAATYARWRTVLLANALTSGAYVLSVNRPRPELGVALGGPSLAAAPTGEILAETTDTITVVSLDSQVVQEARSRYPGYLATRADLYAQGWGQVSATRWPHERR
jgi:predicted amidohydrolase